MDGQDLPIRNNRRPRKRGFRAILLATVLGTALGAAPAYVPSVLAQQQSDTNNLTQQVSPSPHQTLPSLAPIVQKVMPAVVNISVTSTISDMSGNDQPDAGPQAGPPDNNGPNFPPSPFDQFLRRFFQQQMPNMQRAPQNEKRVALGSGFIIDPQGYIVTNNHVVGESGKITVIFQDNSKHPAKIVGRDPKTDLALLKIDTNKPLPYVSWGDSDSARVGDWVMAVGNPFGLGGTVTTGIISARGRDIHSGPFDDFLQLDAPINRGNSGGPTFNMQGQVIGINTAIYSPNGGSVGIGFAIPSDLAKRIVTQLREHGKVERGWLGVQIQEVSPAIASSLGLKNDHGALIADVQPNSPAAKAGLKQGDVILKYDGHEVEQLHDLPRLVARTPAGHNATMTVWRNGKTEQLTADVGKMPENEQMASTESVTPDHAAALGIQLGKLDRETRQKLGIKGDVKGAVVTGVSPDSPAASLGIQPGDVIESINQHPVANPGEAAKLLKQAQESGNKHLLLLLNRHGINEYLGLSVG